MNADIQSTNLQEIQYLSQAALQDLHVSTLDVVARIEHLIHGKQQQRAWNAPKAVITPPDGRYMMATLAAADDPPFLAVKALVLNPDNPHKGLASINSLVTLLDSRSGLPLAVIDGNWVTAVRTAGLSAVAAKRLARPDASVAAFIGCGVQARSHLQALVELVPIRHVCAFARSSANREAFCGFSESLGLTAMNCTSAKMAMSDADIVVTSVTLSPQLVPFLDAHWLKPGVFVTMTDLAAPWLAESLSVFDRIYVDDRDQEASMSKPLVNPEQVQGDLSDLVTGKVMERETAHERTAFVFRGLALGDLAVTGLAYQRALGLQQGTLVGNNVKLLDR